MITSGLRARKLKQNVSKRSTSKYRTPRIKAPIYRDLMQRRKILASNTLKYHRTTLAWNVPSQILLSVKDTWRNQFNHRPSILKRKDMIRLSRKVLLITISRAKRRQKVKIPVTLLSSLKNRQKHRSCHSNLAALALT